MATVLIVNWYFQGLHNLLLKYQNTYLHFIWTILIFYSVQSFYSIVKMNFHLIFWDYLLEFIRVFLSFFLKKNWQCFYWNLFMIYWIFHYLDFFVVTSFFHFNLDLYFVHHIYYYHLHLNLYHHLLLQNWILSLHSFTII